MTLKIILIMIFFIYIFFFCVNNFWKHYSWSVEEGWRVEGMLLPSSKWTSEPHVPFNILESCQRFQYIYHLMHPKSFYYPFQIHPIFVGDTYHIYHK